MEPTFIERQARLLADRDVIDAILRQEIRSHEDMVAPVANMRAGYQAPTPKGWYLPPTILADGAVSPWMSPRPYCRPPAQDGELVVSEDAVYPANSDEGRRFRDAYIGRLQEWAVSFTPHVFDYSLYHYPLADERNLLNRLCDIRKNLVRLRVDDGEKAHEAAGQIDAFLRETDRQSDNDDIVVWNAGRDSEADTPYWQDRERFGREMQAIADDRMQKLQTYEDEERVVLDGLHWSDDASQKGQPDDEAADIREVGERVQEAVAPVLAGLTDSKQLDAVRTLADCLRAAVDGERASLRPWKPFPLDALPRRVADFIRSAAEAHSVDESFVALPVLAVVGAAMGNAWRLRLKDGFEVPPVLWCIVVSRTGSNKSGPFSLAVGPMWQTPPMPSGADALLTVTQGQYVIDDATSEAVLSRLSECSRGLLLSGEELAGWLKSFDAYRKSGGDEQKWIRFWDVKPYRVDRKVSDERTTVLAPAVSIAGAIQPELLGKAADPEKLASGFFARGLLAMPPERKRQWSNAGINKEQGLFWQGLVDHLRTMPFDAIDSNTGQYLPNIVSLSPDAGAIWIQWYGEVADRLHGSEGIERAITAKADVQAARLALVLYGMACALGECAWMSPMPESIMAAGVDLATWFLDETIRVFEATCGSAQGERRTTLFGLVQRLGDKVSPRDLQRSNSRAYQTAEAARDALQDLASAGYGTFDGKVFIAKHHP